MNIERLLTSLLGIVAIAGLLVGCSAGGQTPAPDVAASQETASPAGAAEPETAPTQEPVEAETTPPAGASEEESMSATSSADVVTGPTTQPYEPRTEDGIDVIYFETSNPCSCMAAVGDAVEQAVLTHFQRELQSGELRFYFLVSNAPANMDVVKEFDSQSFDLFIVEYQDGQGAVEPLYDLWSLTGDDEAIIDFVRTSVADSLGRQN